MKKNSINFYPTLTSDMITNITESIDFTFAYECNDEIINLDYKNDEGQIVFDEDSNWNCDDYDLLTNIRVKLRNTNILFGSNGIAACGAKIGVALEWYSAQSKIRSIEFSDQIVTFGNEDYDLSYKTMFPKETFTGVITMNIIVFLKEKSNEIIQDELFLNNVEGINLGIIDSFNVYMTGNGSLFPIKIENLKNNKLWDLQINYEDLDETLLSQGVVLILNSSHKDYKYLDPNSKDYCERLSDEIVSNAIALLISHIRENEGLDNLNENASPGSIMEFLCYCKNTLEINFSTSLDINKSIRKVLEESVD